MTVLPDATRAAIPLPYGFPQEAEPEGSALPLSHYLWILRRRLWRIAAFVATCVIATLIVSLRIQPIYESTATVDIDRQTPQGVIGQEAMRSTLNDADQFLATQIKMIQSDSVLRPVAEKYKLRELEGQADDVAAVNQVEPGEAPVALRNLNVTRPPNTYLLRISYRSPDARLAADVANAVAESYLEHAYSIRIRSSQSLSAFMESQLAELKAKMERSSRALSEFERELNVINPEEKTSILSARLLQLNTEYTNAQADRVRKEAGWDSVRRGSLESAQASDQSQDLRNLVARNNAARERFAEVKAHFGANHPEYRKAAAQMAEVSGLIDQARRDIAARVEVEYREAVNREQMLKQAVTQTKAEFDRINARSFEYQTLKREAESDKALYEELIRKIKEAGINAGFQNSNIRIADSGRPAINPVSPNVRLNVLLAFLLSSLLAVGAAVVTDMLDATIRDPEQVARSMKAEVLGSLPSVKTWRGRLGQVRTGGNALALIKTSENGSQAISCYEEAIRTLRNSILLTDFDRSVRSMLVTSATPAEGKSTAAVHLAVAHAEQNHRTLLIDGDLRRPSVHRRFNIAGATGLSNVLVSEANWRDVLYTPAELPMLSVLPAGPPSRRASDLIGQGMADLLDEAAREFDLIIVDAPPLLGFAEPLQLASVVDGVLIVARAGQTDRKAVATVVGTLRRLRANVLGVVLNEVHQAISQNYYYYGHYGKYYRPATQS
ncbi:MAG: polysaccharide biosynthesis tyrosine autokinase [Bryobacteraceae bacterium]|nr:polysaccharide biosynthesis tyrosine autokinase [Bryobacteraceae bacterium]